MHNFKSKYKVFILFFFSFFMACEDPDEFGDEPIIEFNRFEVFQSSAGRDSVLLVSIDYRDGDGNLGLGPEHDDSIFSEGSFYHFNYYATYLERIGGEFRPITPGPFNPDTIRFTYRFPPITPEGRHKGVRGEIEVLMPLASAAQNSDEIKFEIFIIDRDLNHSNTITTPRIRINN